VPIPAFVGLALGKDGSDRKRQIIKTTNELYEDKKKKRKKQRSDSGQGVREVGAA
jgi:hypothetical protein